nr:MAG TPA: hypothetical protein [Caudoviricetes sp.]
MSIFLYPFTLFISPPPYRITICKHLLHYYSNL